MCLLTSQHREVRLMVTILLFVVVIQHHGGWLAAAFLIQHASAVNPVSVCRVDVRLCVRPDSWL